MAFQIITLAARHFQIMFVVFCLIFLIMSAILHYHWRRYRSGNNGVAVAEVIYFTVSALLLILTFSTLILPDQL